MSDRDFIGFDQLGNRELAKSGVILTVVIVVVLVGAAYAYCKENPLRCVELPV